VLPSGPRWLAGYFGCDPVLLAVIAALRSRRHRADRGTDYFPHPSRARHGLGADVGVDPLQEDGWASGPTGVGRRLVFFEAIGVPGILNRHPSRGTPVHHVVVVGV